MSLLHQQDDDLEPEAPERELTLSTGAIFAIFAGLVLLCAVFFGFGYMVRGRQAPAPILATVAPESTPAASTSFNSFKPAAGSPRRQPAALQASLAVTGSGKDTRAARRRSQAGSTCHRAAGSRSPGASDAAARQYTTCGSTRHAASHCAHRQLHRAGRGRLA